MEGPLVITHYYTTYCFKYSEQSCVIVSVEIEGETSFVEFNSNNSPEDCLGLLKAKLPKQVK